MINKLTIINNFECDAKNGQPKPKILLNGRMDEYSRRNAYIIHNSGKSIVNWTQRYVKYAVAIHGAWNLSCDEWDKSSVWNEHRLIEIPISKWFINQRNGNYKFMNAPNWLSRSNRANGHSIRIFFIANASVPIQPSRILTIFPKVCFLIT